MSSIFDLQEILDLIPGSIYWKNKDGQYLGCNKYQLYIARIKRKEDLIGKTDYELPWAQEADKIREIDELVLKTKSAQIVEEQATRPDGTMGTFLSGKYPLFSKNKEPIGIAGVSVDITAQKEAERLKLEKETLAATQENTLKFASSIAHDVRNHITAMKVGASSAKKLLDRYDALSHFPESKREHTLEAFAAVERNALQAHDFIDLTLECLSPIDEASAQKTFTQFEVAPIIEETLRNYAFSHPSEFPWLSWNLDADFSLYGNPTYLAIILHVIVNNAMDAVKETMREDGKIHIKLAQDSTDNIITIQDNGVGCDAEALDNLFNMFYTTKIHGTGIGLAAAQRRMALMMGRITADAKPGIGMRFNLHFPQQD